MTNPFPPLIALLFIPGGLFLRGLEELLFLGIHLP